jgi:superfamily II DNA or RNA helicase
MSTTTLIAHTAVQPRPYQQRIVAKAVDLFLKKGLRSVLIESPTGSGKTVMGLLVARALQDALG